MSDLANVKSIEAIIRFRSALIVFLEKARVTIDDVNDDVKKTRYWLEHDRVPYWKQQIKKRTRKLDEAKHELFTARLSDFTEDTMLQQMAVNRAKRKLYDAMEKLKVVKHWIREFDSVVMPVAKQLVKIDSLLVARMPKGVAHLEETVKLLDAYSAVNPWLAGGDQPAPAAVETPADETVTEETKEASE